MGTIATINTSKKRLLQPSKALLIARKRCLKSPQNSREKLQNNLQTLKNDTEIPKVLTNPSLSPTLLSINEQYSRCPREVISCPRCLLLECLWAGKPLQAEQQQRQEDDDEQHTDLLAGVFIADDHFQTESC